MRSLDHHVAGDPAAIVRELHHLTEVERRLFRSRFAAALVVQDQVEMYWSPSKRRIMARSAAGARKYALASDAVFIGAYTHPFDTQVFLGDLNDVLERLEVQQRAALARAG